MPAAPPQGVEMSSIRNTFKPYRIVATCVVLGLAAVLFACGDDDDNGPGPASSEASGATPVETPAGSPGGPEECTVSEEEIGLVSKLDFEQEGEFAQGGQFAAGDVINARMRLINCTGDETTLYFDTTKRYEMVITPEDSTDELFNSSVGKEFSDTKGTEVLAAGDTIVYEEPWDQMDAEGQQVPPGIYKVSFLSVGCGHPESEECPPFGPISRIEILE
jgi:hypothetical protein